MKTGTVLLTCLVLGLAAPVASADALKVDATSKQLTQSQVMPVGEAGVLVHATAQTVGFESTMADDPLAGLSGSCFGTVLVGAGGAAGSGYCHYTAPDGATVVVQWFADPAIEEAGTWRIAGGTGRWATALGGGIYTDAATDVAGESVLHAVGSVEFR